MSSFPYVWVVAKPCGTPPDWEAAEKVLAEELADGLEDVELYGLETVTRVRYALEHPDEVCLRTFIHQGTLYYLAIGHPLAPVEEHELLLSLGDSGILEAAGLERPWSGLSREQMDEAIGPR